MIILRRYTVCHKQVTHLFCFLAVERINYGRTAHASEYMQQFLCLVLGTTHDIHKILAPETHAIAILLLETELLLYILSDFASSCRCQRKYRHGWEHIAQCLYLTVGRTEVVPPL